MDENKNNDKYKIEAVTNDNIDNVSKILDSNSITDLNKTDTNGNTPLGLAAQNGNLEIVDLLIKRVLM